MPPEETNILEFNQYINVSMYAYLETLIEKVDGCKNNPKKSSTIKYVNIFCGNIQYLRYEYLNV